MPESRRIRLLLSDVDGTLVTDDKVLTKGAIAACQELHRAGVALALVSSRPPRGLRMLIQPLALSTVIAGCNGALLVKPDLSVIECHSLDPEIAGRSVALLLEQGLEVWVYTESEWLVRDRNAAHVAREEWILQFDAKPVAAFCAADLAQAVKIVGVSDDLGRVAACETSIQTSLDSKVSARRSQLYFLDITHPLANKGAVATSLSNRLNIPPEAIATIGDMPNDVLMFQESGLSIAMGNASDAVKAAASVTTDSNEKEGFAKAVKNFILPLGAI